MAGDATAYDFLLRSLPESAAAAGVDDDALFRSVFAFWCQRQGLIDGGHPRATSPLQVPRLPSPRPSQPRRLAAAPRRRRIPPGAGRMHRPGEAHCNPRLGGP